MHISYVSTVHSCDFDLGIVSRFVDSMFSQTVADCWSDHDRRRLKFHSPTLQSTAPMVQANEILIVSNQNLAIIGLNFDIDRGRNSIEL